MTFIDSSVTFKGLTLKNRIVMAPMCQYSVEAEDGKPDDWHFVHYVSRAVGGTGLIIMEMTDVEPDGRITSKDLGLWSDEQIPAYAKIISKVHKYGAKIGAQIAHVIGGESLDTRIKGSPLMIVASLVMESGMMLLPGALLTGMAAVISGNLYDRWGARRLSRIGFLFLMAVSMTITVSITLDTSYLFLMIAYALFMTVQDA